MANGNPIAHNSDVVSQRDYFERVISELEKRCAQQFSAQESATRAALASSQMAVDKAEQNNKEWKSGHNEWKAAMMEKDRLFATKGSLEKTEEKVDKLETLRDVAAGKASQNSVIGAYVVSIISALIALFIAFIK